MPKELARGGSGTNKATARVSKRCDRATVPTRLLRLILKKLLANYHLDNIAHQILVISLRNFVCIVMIRVVISYFFLSILKIWELGFCGKFA